MTSAGRIVDLLVRAEAAALGGSPGDADAPLDELAGLVDVPAAAAARARWLCAVAAGARGDYGRALRLLEPLTTDGTPAETAETDETAEMLMTRAAGHATAASLLRQIGDHPSAEPLDQGGLALLDRVPASLGPDVRLDCAVGATADAVGLGDLTSARARLEAARRVLTPTVGWRPLVRLHWAETEVALLAGDVPAACTGAAAAVEIAAGAAAPRHLAKSSMFLGVARGLNGELTAAATALHAAAELADRHRLLPLVWPVRAVLATMPGLVDDAAGRAEDLVSARMTVAAIAAELPPERRARWAERDPMVAFLLSDDSREAGHGRQSS